MASDPQELFIVRHYDGFDNCWTDVTEPMPRDDAERELASRTNNGARNASYDDIDYYRIFPADTTMVNSQQGNAELGLRTIR